MSRRMFLSTKALALACAGFTAWFLSAAALAAVNLNTATFDELVAVTGIGPKKAQQIIESRETQGPFKSVDDLKRIKGFRDKLVDNLRAEFTVGPPPAKVAAKDAGKDAARRKDAKAPAETTRADTGRIEAGQRK